MSRAKKNWRLGIDLGGTKIEGALLDPAGRVVCRKRMATRQQGGYESILKRITGLYRALARHAGHGSLTLGIGTPGAISNVTGRLKNSNTQCLNGRFLKEDLMRLLGRPLRLENDANCFALAEARLGAGRGKRMVFGVIMGTGCGGGLVLDGTVWTGPQAIAGEWGHMAIDPRGPRCYCGARGCIETLISGGGVEARYQALHKCRQTLRQIVTAYRSGNFQAEKFMKQFFKDFGRSLANLINVLDPDIVVLGGGVSNMAELYEQGLAQVRRQIFSDTLQTPVVRHQLGDSAGVLGAALMGV